MRQYPIHRIIRLLPAILLLLWSTHASAQETTSSNAGRSSENTSRSARLIVPPPGIVIEKDIAYLAPGRQEKLDLYYASDRPKGVRSPGIVMIHGGGWKRGAKDAPREQGAGFAFAKAGYVAISVEYKKEADDRWPTNLLDCKNGVRWLRRNADRLQVDPDHIGVIGGSAGGHLSLMVAYTSSVKELEPESPYPGTSDTVQACVNLYGITDLLTRQAVNKDGTPNGKLLQPALFTDKREQNPEKWRLASPVYHITSSSPPTFTIHGTADTTVDRDQAKELVDKLKEKGVEHEFLSIPGVGHAFTLDDERLPYDLRPKVIEFFDKHLKPHQ